MPSPITSATQTQAAAPVQRSTASSRPAQPKAQASKAATDTVHLSAASQAQSAAIKELTETRAQTGQEANGGDRQAQRLLAKETAAQSVNK